MNKKESIEDILEAYGQWVYSSGDPKYNGLTLEEAKERLCKALSEELNVVEPCEPECSKERHTYHQGQWDLWQHQQVILDELFGIDSDGIAMGRSL